MDLEQTVATRSRKGFLGAAAGVSASVAAASFGGVLGIGTAVGAGDEVTAMANLAATAEALAVTFYYAGITEAAFNIEGPSLGHLQRTLDAELHHLQIVQSLGGEALQRHFFLPDRLLSDAGTFVQTGVRIETALGSAYLAATHQCAVLGRPALAATTAQLGASEAQHLTLIAHLAGLVPNGQTLPGLDSYRPSSAAPSLAPFLRGGDGFGRLAHLPSADAVQAALGGIRAERVQPLVQRGGAGKGSASCAAPAARRARLTVRP